MREISRTMGNRILIREYIKRNKHLKEEGFESYQDFLKSDIWKAIKGVWWKKRQAKPEFWGRCRICGTDKGLLLHHIKYKRVTRISLSGVIPVCHNCHGDIHEFSNKNPFVSIKVATRWLMRRKNNPESYRNRQRREVKKTQVLQVKKPKKINKSVYNLKSIISQDRKEARAKIKALKEARLKMWSE